MFSLRRISLISTYLLFALTSTSAFAGTALTLAAVGSYGGFNDNQAGATQTPVFGFPGAAALLKFGGPSPLHLELGAWYFNRNTQETFGTSQTTYSQYWAQGTANLLFFLGRHVYLSAGGFYGSQVSGATFHADSSNDYGITGGLGLLLPMGPRMALEISGRYQYGLNNLAAGTINTINDRSGLLLVGFHFGGSGGSR